MHKIKYFLIAFPFSYLFIVGNIYPQDNHSNHSMSDSTSLHRQHMIHSMSPEVMPFDMNKVTHYFIKTGTGGILMIKTKDVNDTVQVVKVQSHLKKEYNLFSNGDFRDPETLHGMNMPGLKVLSQSKDKFKVHYKKLADGARLTFNSNDPKVIDALHQWFDAQLKDHGSDAKSKLN